MFDMLDRCGGNQGKAAEALGISRRTLLRKLKAYRENESETAVGTLCAEQQRYYRKQTSAPVQLKHGEESMDANLLNISLGGAAVSLHKILSQGDAGDNSVLPFLKLMCRRNCTDALRGRIKKATTAFNSAKCLPRFAPTCSAGSRRK